MSDAYQIEIPPSFLALYSDARHRLTIPLPTLRARYELCEDLAHHLTEHCRNIHVDIGVDEQDVLARCQQGLLTPDSGVAHDEAEWIVTRLAELLGWPHPGLSSPSNPHP
ncbi:hypothetical protein [Aquabacterium sp.]|uniref:hypothetical protein n=1 Tax=Aquabacterium sp. TaxID=1872578 RepID=UPI003B68C1A5